MLAIMEVFSNLAISDSLTRSFLTDMPEFFKKIIFVALKHIMDNALICDFYHCLKICIFTLAWKKSQLIGIRLLCDINPPVPYLHVCFHCGSGMVTMLEWILTASGYYCHFHCYSFSSKHLFPVVSAVKRASYDFLIFAFLLFYEIAWLIPLYLSISLERSFLESFTVKPLQLSWQKILRYANTKMYLNKKILVFIIKNQDPNNNNLYPRTCSIEYCINFEGQLS